MLFVEQGGASGMAIIVVGNLCCADGGTCSDSVVGREQLCAGEGDLLEGLPFRYVEALAIDRLSPSLGPVGGGSAVRIGTSGRVQEGEDLRCISGNYL